MKRALLFITLFTLTARADIYLTVTGAQVKKAKIAIGQVHPIAGGTAPNGLLLKAVGEQVRSDLSLINLFDFAPEASFKDLDTARDFYQMNYEEWGKRGVSFVLKLGARQDGAKLILEALLYDVAGQKKIFGTRYQYAAAQYPRLVHTLSEDILKELTGERGLFTSRILMICRDLGQKRNAKVGFGKEVYVADSDGRNLTQLTFDKTISLSPGWSPDGKAITYTQYAVINRSAKRGTVLRHHNLTNGERKTLSARDGMNSGASWAPNGKRIATTLSFNGRPEIYLISPQGEGEAEPFSRAVQVKRIGGEGYQPNYPSLLFDVEPRWAPDGKRIVFSSARSGHPMIYVADVDSKVANQLTFAGQYNSSPDWSPKGDKILFAAQRLAEGNFDIYVIDPDGNNLNRVTSGDNPNNRRKSNSENPSWAPTGRHLAFSSNEDNGNYGIYVMALDGSGKRKISPDGKECFNPAWGAAE